MTNIHLSQSIQITPRAGVSIILSPRGIYFIFNIKMNDVLTDVYGVQPISFEHTLVMGNVAPTLTKSVAPNF